MLAALNKVFTSRMLMLTYTTVAMLAFAANSVICRLALQDNTIDPASFTAIRLFSGALLLLTISWLRPHSRPIRGNGSWTSGLLLFMYAACFSYAYVALHTGVGALILFGFVQATMIAIGFLSGDRPHSGEWLGWLIAAAGLVWLLLPGSAAPPPASSALMVVAGIAWGLYSLRGRTAPDALAATSTNFLYSCVFAALLTVATFSTAELSARGIMLAISSGALTSALGYVIWYAALNYLRTMQAALVQLSVPTIAAAGGVALLSEQLSVRLVIASMLILGGIGFALTRKAG